MIIIIMSINSWKWHFYFVDAGFKYFPGVRCLSASLGLDTNSLLYIHPVSIVIDKLVDMSSLFIILFQSLLETTPERAQHLILWFHWVSPWSLRLNEYFWGTRWASQNTNSEIYYPTCIASFRNTLLGKVWQVLLEAPGKKVGFPSCILSHSM